MLGAIAGDIIGSVYERHPIKTTSFPLFVERSRFTDDTVLTVAVAYAILHGVDYAAALRQYGRRYPRAGYGDTFSQWLFSEDMGPYNSWGNGSAMRVSPVALAFDDEAMVLAQAAASAAVTHNHPEGIKGAQATALAVFLARTGRQKEDIRARIHAGFGYDLTRTVEEIRPKYRFDVSCQGTVPPAIIAFLDASDYEDAVRLAVSLGGDSDTLACIAGSIAAAYEGDIPVVIADETCRRLPPDLLSVVDEFHARFG
jgi:ADP-ribosylglycohydrolase